MMRWLFQYLRLDTDLRPLGDLVYGLHLRLKALRSQLRLRDLGGNGNPPGIDDRDSLFQGARQFDESPLNHCNSSRSHNAEPERRPGRGVTDFSPGRNHDLCLLYYDRKRRRCNKSDCTAIRR